jgi:hypothetical protein
VQQPEHGEFKHAGSLAAHLRSCLLQSFNWQVLGYYPPRSAACSVRTCSGQPAGWSYLPDVSGRYITTICRTLARRKSGYVASACSQVNWLRER